MSTLVIDFSVSPTVTIWFLLSSFAQRYSFACAGSSGISSCPSFENAVTCFDLAMCFV